MARRLPRSTGRSSGVPLPAAAPREPIVTPAFVACAAGLVLLCFATFYPALSAGFISWDDPNYVRDNARLDTSRGLAEIWNPGTPKLEQFYPLVFTSYWIENHIWGRNPHGYHATNVALHALNAVLVLALARALGLPLWAALIAAAVFAAHPVQVASVVWIAERKNTLSTLFYLAAFLVYLRHRRTGSWFAYAGYGLFFVAALLAKTQVLTLPVVVILADLWQQRAGRLPRAALAALLFRAAPLLLIGRNDTLIISRIEAHNGPKFEITTPAQRPFIAAAAGWFYLAKFVVPVPVAPMYPKWNVRPDAPIWWLPLLAWPVAAALAWRFRRAIDPLLAAGVVQFLVSILPALGLMPFNYQQYSYVADHYLYLPAIGGGIAIAAVALRLTGSSLATLRGGVVTAAAGALVGAGAAYAHFESRHWDNIESYWKHAIALNSRCFPANYNLGNHYVRNGRTAEAIPLYAAACQIDPTVRSAFASYFAAVSAVQGPAAVISGATPLLDAPNLDRNVRWTVLLARGNAYLRLGQRPAALDDYHAALSIVKPGSPAAGQINAALQRAGVPPAAPR